MSAEEPKRNPLISMPLSGNIDAPPMSRRRPIPPSLVSRYEDIRFLGEGGMGTVYRARDPRLGRTVAVKLLKNDDAELWRRFIAEARAQASIEHENVCRVYDAGEVDGEPFIAMQYIEGDPLSKLKEKLTLEQSIRVMHQISLAVHEAHRLGIIHRDIKPGNVLCEKLADGSVKPYIMDFGLAREVEEKGQTQTGAVIGTPAYMPPEQAKGDVRAMDRRSDVYSLGATLYDVIAGRPPFVSEHAWTLLMAVAYEEPPALGKVKNGVPVDLETIVMKAIERDPARRYDSARALAEDLQRYLDGDPILARRSSLGYVLWKKAKKNKLITAVLVTVLASAVVLAGVWVRARRQAAEQARLAQQLGEGVKEMELFLRAAYELPVHDVERERDVVRDRLKEIELRMGAAGKAGEGPGNYAIGRGYLALGNLDLARDYLEKASKAGYASADLEYALGRAYGELFRRAVDDTKRITNEDERKKKIAELEKALRDPGLLHLRAALSARIEVPEYAEGLIALYEGKNDEALAKAKTALGKAPWMYEAKKLEGDALYAEGSKYRHDAAFDYDKMKSYFDPASVAYRIAADMGRSDPDVHRAECDLWEKVGTAEGMKGAPSDAPFETANAACLRAVQSSSKDGGARVQRANVLASYLLRKVQDDFPVEEKLRLSDETIRAAQEAVDASPNDVMAHYAMAGARQVRAMALQASGKDAPMDDAIAAFQRALAIDPKFTWALSELGDVYVVHAENEMRHGRPVADVYRKAIQQFEQALVSDPKFAMAAGRRLVAYRKFLESEMERGRQSPETIKAFFDALAQYEKLAPGPWLVAYWKVRANVLHAAYEASFGRSPDAPLKVAFETIHAFAGKLPDDYWFLQALAECRGVEAMHAMTVGRDIAPIVDDTRLVAKKAVTLRKVLPDELRLSIGRTELAALRDAKAKATLKSEQFASALDYVQPRADDAEPYPPLYVLHAELMVLRAQWAIESKTGKPDEDIATGLASVGKALVINPRMPRALAMKGQLLLMKAYRIDSARDRADIARSANETLQAALHENPFLETEISTSLKAARTLIQ